MDRVEKLREESSSEHVAFTEFTLKLRNGKDNLFCFFEGKDDVKYYGIRIRNITQREYESINCEGKENVIKAHRLISSKKEYSSIKTLYFIDLDYQEEPVEKSIYCLPSYSIENQYVKKSVLENVLRNEFSLKSESSDFSKVLEIYEALQAKFHSETRYINAWLACQSDERFKYGKTPYLKIDSTIGGYFKTIVKSKMDTVSSFEELNNLSEINRLFPKALSIMEKDIVEKIKYFESVDEASLFRGKFELAFFVDFMKKLQSEIGCKSSVIFDDRYKCNLRFEFSTALTILSSYAETPRSLIIYLEKFKMIV